MREALSFAITLMVVLGLVLSPHYAVALSRGEGHDFTVSTRRTDNEIDETVSRLIAQGDYAEGEVIVCYLGSADQAPQGISAQSDDSAYVFLAGAEKLSTVSARQYAEATGEAIPLRGEQGTLSVQSSEGPVEILKVCDYGLSTEQLLRELLRDPQVLSAEPNYLMQFEEDGEPVEAEENATTEASDATTAPNDLDIQSDDETPTSQPSDDIGPSTGDLTNYQWFSVGAAAATPQYVNEANPGVNAPNWNDPSTTNASGAVAILDSGVDYTHPDLAGVMYHFSPELQAELGCGEFGYAPARADKTDPMDGFDHGTHCAGIVAAEWNGFGVSGIANGAKLVAVSITRSESSSDYSYDSIIKGYDFLIRAVEAGVDIRSVNRSLSMTPANNADEVMVRAAGEAGILTCIASGNEHRDLEEWYMDADLLQPNPYVVRVNASSPQERPAPFSNYGRYITDLFAPGISILSTLPSNQESMRRYFVQADDDPLYVKTDFSDMVLDVSSEREVQVNDVAQGEIGFDGDGSSVKAAVSTYAGAYAAVYVDVPLGTLSSRDVQDISVAFNFGENEARYPGLSIMLEDGSFADSSTRGVMELCDSGPNGWCFLCLHFSDKAELSSDFAKVIDSQGNSCVRLLISFRPFTSSYEPDVPIDSDIYVDQIAFGRPGNSAYLPYCYMCGTSMATPVVTGAAAIVSSSLYAANPAERAAETVHVIKGAVRQPESYHGLCKQNGHLDLSLLGETDAFVPVIDSAQVSGSTLVVDGSYFSSGGTLFVGGEEAEVLSWSDGSIEAAWPQGLASGLIPIAVRTSEGAEACRAFILEAPQGTAGSVTLYERDVKPINLRPDETSVTSIPGMLVATDDGTLFAAPTDSDDRPYASTRFLMRSDDQGASWTSVELPVELKSVQLAADEDKVFVLGGTPADRSFGLDYFELYCYDAKQGTFEHLASHDTSDEDEGLFHSMYSSVAYVNGSLFCIDFYTDRQNYDEPGHERIRRFNAQTGLLEDAFLLTHDYSRRGFLSPPKIAVVGNSFYVCNMSNSEVSRMPVEMIVGLERVDVASDGSLSSVDLSAALYPLGGYVAEGDFCLAASEEGLFLIGDGLDALVPSGADRSDTFLMKDGSSSFEPYSKTLSYAPFTTPVAVCADGWLYAYAISNYEETPVFGRATRVAEEPEPAPEPEPEPEPAPDEPDDSKPDKDKTPVTPDSRKALPKTGDDLGGTTATAILVATAGIGCLALGIRRRQEP